MAQKSKKNHIVTVALPLFIDNGFKGTSIDLVVKRSAVSKPTVYNHFPDKSALMDAVMELWIESNKPLIRPIRDRVALQGYISQHWLTRDTVRLYALVIGEGWRFPLATQRFWGDFDHFWRKALIYASRSICAVDSISIEALLDRQLLTRLEAP